MGKVLERGDIVRIKSGIEKYKHGIVVHSWEDGTFSAISQDGFWALADRTEWEKVGHLDISVIYDKLRELDGLVVKER